MQFPQASVFRDEIGPRTRYREEALFWLLKPSHGVPPWGTCLSQRDRRCFGVRAAERSVDAALVVPEEANLFDTPGGKPTLSSFSISIRFTASS